MAAMAGYYKAVSFAYGQLIGKPLEDFSLIVGFFFLHCALYKAYESIKSIKTPPWRTIYWEKNIVCLALSTADLFAGHVLHYWYDIGHHPNAVSLGVVVVILFILPSIFFLGCVIAEQQENKKRFYRDNAMKNIKEPAS